MDLVYPVHCVLCGLDLTPGEPRTGPVCAPCLDRLRPMEGRRCRVCGLPLISEEEVCTRCRGRAFAFDGHRARYAYQGEVRELLHLYKFKGRAALGNLFAEWLAPKEPADQALLVPVPSSGRGRTHMERVTRRASRLAGIRFCPCLARKPGAVQKTLDFEERQANLKGRIDCLAAPGTLAGRAVLLLDDIFTTGATAHECAAVLKANGAVAVAVRTIAMDL